MTQADDQPKTSVPRRNQRQAELILEATAHCARALGEREPVDRALNQWLRKRRYLGSRDRRIIGDVVFSWLRWKGWFEIEERPPLAHQCTWAYYADHDTPHPAVDALAGEAGLSGLKSLTACSLKEKAGIFQQWMKRPQPLPLEDLAPAWLAKRLPPSEQVPEADPLRLLEQFQVRPPTWLLSMKDDGWEDRFELPLQQTRWNDHDVVSVPGSTNLNLAGPAHERPFEVQDLASQAVGWVCDPAPGQAWWDLCCGAGGKTLQLARLMDNRGRLTATDIRRPCVDELRTRAARHDIPIQCARRLDPLEVPAPDGPYDGILVDAPCSGIGTWARNPDARWRIYENTIPKQAARQVELLSRALEALKPGGTLVYAVCTLTQEETLGVTERFLEAHPEVQLVSVPHPLTGEATDGRIWIWPWQGPCNGMYIARFKVQG